MISYAEAKRRAQAAKPNWNEEEYIAKAIIYWADAEYEYDLEIENEGDSDDEFAAWIEEHAEELAREATTTTQTSMPSTTTGANSSGSAGRADKPALPCGGTGDGAHLRHVRLCGLLQIPSLSFCLCDSQPPHSAQSLCPRRSVASCGMVLYVQQTAKNCQK